MLMLCLHLSSFSLPQSVSLPPFRRHRTHYLSKLRSAFHFSTFQNDDEHEQGSAHRNGDRYSVKYARVWFGAEMLQTSDR